jgi:alanine dehydrogenase
MAGRNAAMIAAGMGAQVVILDINVAPLRHIDELSWGRVTTVTSSVLAIEHYIAESDMVVGAVLVPGARAPIVVSEEMVTAMRPGSVVVDISIDQGGCIATAHETTHTNPVYEIDGVIHYAVGTIPLSIPFSICSKPLPK